MRIPLVHLVRPLNPTTVGTEANTHSVAFVTVTRSETEPPALPTDFGTARTEIESGAGVASTELVNVRARMNAANMATDRRLMTIGSSLDRERELSAAEAQIRVGVGLYTGYVN